jgi:hypothetical protein
MRLPQLPYFRIGGRRSLFLTNSQTPLLKRKRIVVAGNPPGRMDLSGRILYANFPGKQSGLRCDLLAVLVKGRGLFFATNPGERSGKEP